MNERERLIKLIDDGCFEACKKKNDDVKLAQYLADYLLANGVIIPPVKVGDTVYQTDNAGDIYESKITEIIYGTKDIAFGEIAIGKTIFLTKEEAEKALKDRKQ